MALLIVDDCTACDACKPVCPNEAIAVGDPIYLIDAAKCTECVGAHAPEGGIALRASRPVTAYKGTQRPGEWTR